MLAFIEEMRGTKSTEPGPRRAQGSVWNFTVAVSPLDLYCYLKMRFGEPNGFMMVLRNPSVDNFCHWHYTLQARDTMLDILGLDVRMEIRCAHISGISETSWKTLEEALLDQFALHRKALETLRRSFERWHLFINPYRRLTAIVDRYVARLKQLDIANIVIPSMQSTQARSTRAEFSAYIEAITRVQDSYREAMALTTSIQLIAPVMAEAAINMVLLLLAKPEVRADRRLYDDFARRNIDVRIKSLPLCCSGFTQGITGSEEPFKDVLRLMSRRNDALHGNVDPTASTGEEIFFDHGTIPLTSRNRPMSEIGTANALANAKPDEALRDVATVQRFVDFLISRLDQSIQAEIRRALNEEQLGYRPDMRRLGVILPRARVDFVGLRETDDSRTEERSNRRALPV